MQFCPPRVPHQGSGLELTLHFVLHICINIVPYLLIGGLCDSVGALVLVAVLVNVVFVVGRTKTQFCFRQDQKDKM